MLENQEGQAQQQQTTTQESAPSTLSGTTTQPPAEVAADAGQSGSGSAEPLSFELALPQDSKVTKERVDEIAAFARERGLSPEVAQAIVDGEHKAVAAYEAGLATALESNRKVWLDDLKADKEFGGERYNETITLAKRAWDKYATDGLKQLCKGALGDAKDLIVTFARIGRQEAEDQVITDKAPSNRGPKSIEERMFPNMG